MNSSIDCPSCGTRIDLDLATLIGAPWFECGGCSATIGIHYGNRARAQQVTAGWHDLLRKRRALARRAARIRRSSAEEEAEPGAQELTFMA
ncbi:hypothetical protein [Billgrantia endophytica]|uniref:Transcription factor zinc-finger domain-containing protein n=1 Tax=Billgrantia endophytica TaxID=2033802 RepID=A0A2N7U7Q4_9GAMM|nr:hypothetical protein [Halomonas endophytica]PMR76453.1 hypothetical protein C1H69_05245 [Halomonas endophytica]